MDVADATWFDVATEELELIVGGTEELELGLGVENCELTDDAEELEED